LPNQVGEKVAALRLDKLGAKLTETSAAQANYLHLPSTGPFKLENYHHPAGGGTSCRV
jgi:adenosylhomocysteinase